MARRTRTRDPRQLALPCNLEERPDPQQLIAWLEEEMGAQQAAMAAQQTTIEAQQTTIEDLSRRLFEVYRSMDEVLDLRAANSKLRHEVALLQMRLMLAPRASAPLPDWLSGELRRLLAVAHPDKWSAGQDAQALAHEVAATINTLRQRLGEA